VPSTALFVRLCLVLRLCLVTHTHVWNPLQTLERKNLNPKKPEDRKDESLVKKDAVKKDAPKEVTTAKPRGGGGGGGEGGGGGRGESTGDAGSRPSSVNLNEMFAGVQNMFSAQEAKLSPRTRL